jgi:hypothetical protein
MLSQIISLALYTYFSLIIQVHMGKHQITNLSIFLFIILNDDVRMTTYLNA